MKKVSLAVVAGLLAMVGSAHAQINADAFVNSIALATINTTSPIANVINWKVGEFQDLNIQMQSMPLGTIHKVADREEGNGLWVKEEMSGGMIGNHTVEELIDRATGKVLKMKQDGQDQQVPDDKIEIINQETASVTVPAGTFQVIHITAKSEKTGQIEAWMNPKAITLDGTAKMTMQAQGMPIALELTKFGGR
jgi:hypothetical protein